MEINIKPEEIDVYVKKAIIESSIGKIINDNSKKYMEEYLSHSYNSPIRSIIQQVVREILENEMKKPENTKIILEEFNRQFNSDIMRKVIHWTLDKFTLSFNEK